MTKVGIRPDLHPNTMKCHEIFNDHRLPGSDCSQGKRVPLSAVPRTQHNASSKRRYSLRDCSHCSIHIVLGGFFSKHLNNPALVPLVLISAAGPSGRKYQMLQEIILRVTQRCWLQRDLSFPSSNRAALSLCLGQMSAADSVAQGGPRLPAQTTASNVSMMVSAGTSLAMHPLKALKYCCDPALIPCAVPGQMDCWALGDSTAASLGAAVPWDSSPCLLAKSERAE